LPLFQCISRLSKILVSSLIQMHSIQTNAHEMYENANDHANSCLMHIDEGLKHLGCYTYESKTQARTRKMQSELQIVLSTQS